MIRVIIATCNRPDMLRQALKSVSAQTVRSHIGSVLVSENGGNRQSAQVCAEFPELPIQYILRDPPVAPIEHARILFSGRTPEKYIAILHDDDWWDPQHLEIAVNGLDANPHCSGAFSNFHETLGPAFPAQTATMAWRVWVAAGGDFGKAGLELDLVATLVACLLEGAFHYSTSVARGETMRSAFTQLIATGNPYDNDRLFPILLAEKGNLLYSPRPTAFVRIHSGRDCMQPQYSTKHALLVSATTLWMQERWPMETRQAAERFNATINGIAPDLLRQLSEAIVEPQKSTLIEKCDFHLFRHPQPPRPKRGLRWLVRQLTPHGALMARRHFLKWQTVPRAGQDGLAQ